eukprot:Blabericola_migrator_1__12715@NODE_814_length_6413_cov_62_691302_g574_i0_p3_GENE_NODE_814_length_6413_cov_62_691302_g574_i0NODE_814_length_6413_cov_62_691302_g574_i0_p3_ORF_typecomplete_len190_score39_50_NODE_814_length_6413_cov_62_691302_g574_i049445513
MDAYVTGLKEWCAAALDVFISRMERDLSTPVGSSEAPDSQQEGELAPWTPRFYKQVASHQREAFEALVDKASRDNPGCRKELCDYKEEHGVTHDVTPTSLMSTDMISVQEGLQFISGLLRNASPDFFLREANDIAHTLRCFGGPCHLVNLIQNMYLHPEDIVEYKRLRRSVEGTDDTDLEEVSTIPVVG